eukprot:scaffold2315_cov145-Isochrysis_galbana.AAC.1
MEAVLKPCSLLSQEVVRLFKLVYAFLKSAQLHIFAELRADGPVAPLRCRRAEPCNAPEGRRGHGQVRMRAQDLSGHIEARKKLETPVVDARRERFLPELQAKDRFTSVRNLHRRCSSKINIGPHQQGKTPVLLSEHR